MRGQRGPAVFELASAVRNLKIYSRMSPGVEFGALPSLRSHGIAVWTPVTDLGSVLHTTFVFPAHCGLPQNR